MDLERPERLVIDCRAQAGAPHGRPARPDDAQRIVALINAAHQREELFLPYTVQRLAARLGREPATYGWTHLLVGERAVVGVRAASIRIQREGRGGREESGRALVIDTGFAPGAEGDLVALLRAWCATLMGHGFTQMTLFTSPGAGRLFNFRQPQQAGLAWDATLAWLDRYLRPSPRGADAPRLGEP